MTLWPSTYANLPQQGAPNENAAGSRAAVVISRACHKFPDVNNLTRYSVHAKRSNQKAVGSESKTRMIDTATAGLTAVLSSEGSTYSLRSR